MTVRVCNKPNMSLQPLQHVESECPFLTLLLPWFQKAHFFFCRIFACFFINKASTTFLFCIWKWTPLITPDKLMIGYINHICLNINRYILLPVRIIETQNKKKNIKKSS